MPKRSSRAAADDAAPAKQGRTVSEPTTRVCIVYGLHADSKTAVARKVIKELQSATLLTTDAQAGRKIMPKKGPFEVVEYKTADPQPPPHATNVVVLPHELARPTRAAAAAISSNPKAIVRLMTVIDARTFLLGGGGDE